jgi:hypothetical protein
MLLGSRFPNSTRCNVYVHLSDCYRNLITSDDLGLLQNIKRFPVFLFNLLFYVLYYIMMDRQIPLGSLTVFHQMDEVRLQ